MAVQQSAALIGFEWSPVALCVTRQRVVVACNPAFGELFDYPVAELVGASMAVLYPSRQEFRRIGQRGYPSMRQGRRYQDAGVPASGVTPQGRGKVRRA